VRKQNSKALIKLVTKKLANKSSSEQANIKQRANWKEQHKLQVN
jgi:hypothetical protein